MANLDSFNVAKNQFFSSRHGNAARTEKLRTILQEEQGRDISLGEAESIASELIGLYKALAGDLTITRGGLKNRDQLLS